AGGHLKLEPMDTPFAGDRVSVGKVDFTDIDLGGLIADSTLSDRVQLTAIIDGDLAFRAAPDGFHITGGQAQADRPGRLTIKPGVLTQTTAEGGPVISGQAPGVEAAPMQDLAYQALEDLAYDRLDATIAPQPAGRLGILFH